jgi:outer membrane protein assembly factor BamB
MAAEMGRRSGFAAALGAVLAAVLVGCTSKSTVVPSTSLSSSAPTPVSTSPSPTPSSTPSEQGWITFGHDPARTGIDPTSPDIGDVRKAWNSAQLDGAVYAQPLVFRGHVLIATQNNSIYSFDAATGAMRWRRHFGDPVPRAALPCGNIDPTGITSTPVIDPATGLLYAVAFLDPGHHELFALDSEDGRLRFHRAVDPSGSDPRVHQQRSALTISKGRVYIAYGGLFGDCGDYHGLVVGSALDGSGSLLVYRVPSERQAGIWAPGGPVVDPSGDLFVATGNSASRGSFDFGNAVVRLSPELKVVDWFAPANWLDLNAGDVDLASVSPALLPDGLVFAIGKEGVGFLLHRDGLGRIGGEAFAARVCDGPAFGGAGVMAPFLYVSCSGGLVALQLKPGPSFDIAWSADGMNAGPPIIAGGAVWSIDVSSGVLLAFDPQGGRQLFQASVGNVTHFTSPAAANGRLYVATEGGRVYSFEGI